MAPAPQDSNLSSTVVISAGTTFELPVQVYPGCLLCWSFKTEGGDISFQVDYKPDAESPAAAVQSDPDDESVDRSTAVPPSVAVAGARVPSDETTIAGMLRVAKSGTYTLKFDNGYSYFASKTLDYTVHLEEPLGGFGGPRAASDQPNVVFVLGGPGAGKGTQCAKLAKEFGFLHVSAGDLLRAERADPKSAHGSLINTYIKEGKIVPVAITVGLLWRAIRASGRRFVLVDGFPRNRDNLDGWNAQIGERAHVVCALSFDCPDDVLTARLLGRGQGRDDDNAEAIRKRLATFHNETEPILRIFEAQKKLVRIDGNRALQLVSQDLHSKLEERLKTPLPAADDFFLAIPRNSKPPLAVLGTMSIGGVSHLGEQEARQILREYVHAGRDVVDTARMFGKGDTERVLGRVLKDFPGVRVCSKVNPFAGLGGNLSPASVAAQVGESLAALRVDCLDVLYLHAPDPATPIEQTLEACDALHRRGKFRELGLCNFPSWQVAHCHHVCAARGWVLPTVYQGMYSAVNRDVEAELVPCLRALGIRFYAANPLAGGLLTAGRYLESGDEVGAAVPESDRFGVNQQGLFRDRYWKSSFFAAVAPVDAVCRQFNVPVQDAALRWLAHHSALRASKGDGVVLGVSTVAHLSENLTSLATRGPLPLPVLVALEKAWTQVRGDCPRYFRA